MAIRPYTGPSKTISPHLLAYWASLGGWTGEDQVTAVAVALAESGGRIDAVHTNANGSKDYGVWQINSVHSALFDKYPQWWSSDNAHMAYAVWTERRTRGNGWAAWSTYNTGAYRLYLSRARAGVADPDTPTVDPGDAGVITPGEKIADALNPTDDIAAALAEVGNAVKGISQGVWKAGAWLADRDNWVRIGQVTVGATLVVTGLAIVATPKAIAAVGKVAGTVTTKGTK